MAHNAQTNASVVGHLQAAPSGNQSHPANQPQSPLLAPQRDPYLRPGQKSNCIFREADLKRIQQLRIKVLTTPLTFLVASSVLVFTSKKLKLRKLIANPLKDESEFARNDKYWRFASLNSIVMGTFGFLAFSFHRNQLNKAEMFKKYEKEVSVYMKWRIQKETKQYLIKSA